MHPMLNIAVRASRTAGNIIVRAFEQHDKIEVSAKGTNDFVTNVDKQVESAIIETIRKSYPTHSIVGEECGEIAGDTPEFQWVIDPIDGTTNFIKGIPHFAVSIALRVKGKVEQAVVYDPIRGDLFTASKGKGTQLNGFRVRVGNAKDLSGTVLATGFPFKHKHHVEPYMNMLSSLFTKSSDIRRAGSAALDLAYVAAGKIDGFWEIGLKPWDTAAGELLITEAGGMITDFVGGHNQLQSGNTVAGNAKVIKALLSEIRPHLTESLSR